MGSYTVPRSPIEKGLQDYTIGGKLGLFGQEQTIKTPDPVGTGLLKQFKAVSRTPAQPYFSPELLSTINNRGASLSRIQGQQASKELAARAGNNMSSPMYQFLAQQQESGRAAGVAENEANLRVKNQELGEAQKQNKLGNINTAYQNRLGQANQQIGAAGAQQNLIQSRTASGQGAGQMLSTILPLLMMMA